MILLIISGNVLFKQNTIDTEYNEILELGDRF